MDACKHSSTKVQVARARTSTGQHRTRTPRALGRLVALYEHATFTAGAVWNLDSFDQWGVELGKKACSSLLPILDGPATAAPDSSTDGLVKRYRHWRGR